MIKENRLPVSKGKQVASATTLTSLLAENTNRAQWCVFNDSTAVLYLKYGATVSSTDYTVKIAAGGFYEAPFPCYTGAVAGVWASANGYAYVTEVS